MRRAKQVPESTSDSTARLFHDAESLIRGSKQVIEHTKQLLERSNRVLKGAYFVPTYQRHSYVRAKRQNPLLNKLTEG